MILASLFILMPWPQAIDSRPQVPVPSLAASHQSGGQGSGKATSGYDDFDRADAFDLGADWTVVTGPITILGNRAHLPGIGSGTCTLNNVNAPYASSSVSIEADSDGQLFCSVGVLTAYSASRAAVNVKVVDNDVDGLFDSVWFTLGTTGLSWGSSQYVHNFATPTQTLKLTATIDMNGDRAVATIENHASGATEIFHGDNVSNIASGLGTGFGLAVSGRAYADNFEVNGGGAQMQLSASGAPGGVMSFDATGATPGATVAIIWSLSLGSYMVPNNFPCAGTELGLGNPLGWALVGANAIGVANLTRFVPPGAAGRVHMQALDLSSCGLSNVISL
jgi:hypothetical protein